MVVALRLASSPAAFALLLLAAPAADAQAQASAVLRDAAGKPVGEATLREAGRGVLVHLRIDRLPPGKHAVHVHERGRCEGDFDSAGGHFAPRGHSHGFLNPKGPHAGDLPNLFVPADGTLEVEFHSPWLTLDGSEGVLDADGAALIVHSGADDYESDPAGHAGGRIACGVLAR